MNLLVQDGIRPGSQPQDANKKDSKVLSEGDKPKTPAENEAQKKGKAAEGQEGGQPTATEGEEIKQENPENPEGQTGE